MLRHVIQPVDSACCGQACVAALAGVTLEQACREFGHACGTRTRDLIAGIGGLGLGCAGRLRRVTQKDWPWHTPGIFRINWPGEPHGHWAAWDGWMVYDPAVWLPQEPSDWRDMQYVTSMLEVSGVVTEPEGEEFWFDSQVRKWHSDHAHELWTPEQMTRVPRLELARA